MNHPYPSKGRESSFPSFGGVPDRAGWSLPKGAFCPRLQFVYYVDIVKFFHLTKFRGGFHEYILCFESISKNISL